MSVEHSFHHPEPGGPDDVMSVLRKKRRKPPEADMDITPMIDITFLLLIFFLVASRVDQEAGVALPPARFGTPVASKNAVILTVAYGTEDEAIIYMGDGKAPENRVKSSGPLDQEEEIAQYIEAQLNATTPKEFVLIKGERAIKHREVARVTRAVGKAVTGQQLYIAVLEEH